MKRKNLLLVAGAAIFLGFFFRAKEEELEDRKMVWLINEENLEGLKIKQQFISPSGEVVTIVSLNEYLRNKTHRGSQNPSPRALTSNATTSIVRKTFPLSGKK